ncbi:zinc finger MYM-type protein 1-like [Nematostella vectensis]|uniref:zinc finger MYM-type protein 1-like n=1 Tax=Nematostella vectensis TaxID=45351 RepID=UPI00207712B4|nr:zinc finger MYM-type protein 1-like [Nematostella vectensis]
MSTADQPRRSIEDDQEPGNVADDDTGDKIDLAGPSSSASSASSSGRQGMKRMRPKVTLHDFFKRSKTENIEKDTDDVEDASAVDTSVPPTDVTEAVDERPPREIILSVEPFHPKQIKRSETDKEGKAKKRNFQLQYFHDFPWLHYIPDKDVVVCHVCTKAVKLNLLDGVRQEPAFTTKGFNTWRNATKMFRLHQNSKCHKQAVECVREIPAKCRDVSELLVEQTVKERENNRRYLSKIIQNLQFLARQGIAIQGAKETDSNFHQCLLLRAKDDPSILQWMSKKTDKYTSHDVQNELLDIMSQQVIRDVANRIKTECYSLLADECTDVANKEQLTVCLRWIDENLNPNEDFIGFYHIPDISSDTIVSALKDALTRSDIPLKSCRGQCYDGAGNMSGVKNGAATKIQAEVPQAHLTHCHGHALSLAVHDMCKRSASKLLSETLDTTREICKLIKFSPKRQGALEKIKGELDLDAPGIKVLCPTRWTVRGDSFLRIIQNYVALANLWTDCLSARLDSETRARIIGVQCQMKEFDYFFGLNLGNMLFSITDNLSKTLQKTKMSAVQGQRLAELTITTLSNMRSEQNFSDFYALVLQRRNSLECEISEPKLPRKRAPPKKLDDGSEPYHPPAAEDRYRTMYFSALDDIVMAITERFDQKGFKVYRIVEEFLLKAVRGVDFTSEMATIESEYGTTDVNVRNLTSQIPIFRQLMEHKDVTHFDDIYKEVQSLDKPTRSLIGEIVKLCVLLLVNPATDAIGERSFSTMRRLKTWLRSTMGQKRFNSLAVLSVHRERTDKINLAAVANEFVRLNDNRRRLFGEFSVADFC